VALQDIGRLAYTSLHCVVSGLDMYVVSENLRSSLKVHTAFFVATGWITFINIIVIGNITIIFKYGKCACLNVFTGIYQGQANCRQENYISYGRKGRKFSSLNRL
jgi:uncharacterized membrane protein